MYDLILFIILLIAGVGCAFTGKKGNNVVMLGTGIGLAALGSIILFATILATLGVLLAAAGIFGLLTAGKKNKIVLAVVTIAGAILILVGQSGGPSAGTVDRLLNQTEQLNFAQGEALAQFIRENYSGKTVAAILPPYQDGKPDRLTQAMMDGFAKGFGGQPDAVVVREALVIDESGDVPVMAQMREYESGAAFDELFQSAKADVLLNLAGLPGTQVEISRCETLQDGKTVMILPESEYLNPALLADAVRDGAVGALVVINPKSSLKNLPEDMPGMFKARFTVLTPQNIEEYIQNPAYQSMFIALPDEE